MSANLFVESHMCELLEQGYRVVIGADATAAAKLPGYDGYRLIVHGDDDQIVAVDASAKLAAKLVKNSVLKIYPGGSHSLGETSREQLNKDLLDFARS